MFRKILFATATACWIFAAGQAFGEKPPAQERPDIVLTPADQLILDAIGKVNDRIDNVNTRIDNLWITMLGGFLGVMAFIGALVFWDRRTFMNRATEQMRVELKEDRRKMEGIIVALKNLGTRFPEVNEVLRSFGML